MDSSNYSMPLIPEEIPQQQKQSPLGTASLILGILTLLGVCLTIGLSLYSNTLPTQTAENITIFIGLLAIGTFAIGLVGIALALADFFQKTRSKTLAIIGLILSSVSFLIFRGI